MKTQTETSRKYRICTGKKGIILISVYLVIAVLLILGSAFVSRSISENNIARQERDAIRAFYIAEAGIERALYDLKQDFENGDSDPWRDGDINGNTVSPDGPDDNNFYSLYNDQVSFSGGSYNGELKNVAGEIDKIWVRSTGSYGAVTKTIQVYCQIRNYSPWNNAIFVGTGTGGTAINGNVDVRGSIHILGTGLSSTDFAINLGGGASIGNNYQGIPAALGDRIVDLPTVIFNGESVESLGAEVRIKNGLIGLSGTSTIGGSDNWGDSYKETVDGVYVADGYGGNKGAANVYSDNGTANAYDLGDTTVTFPSLSDPYQDYASYQDYLRDNALVISDSDQLDEFENLTPDSDFSYSDGVNTIAIDGDGNLTISGIVYIDGGELEMKMAGSNKTIIYSGQGSIFTTGEIGIEVNLLTQGPDSFPDNIIGFMTPDEMEIKGNIDVMGAFYGETRLKTKQQVNIAGTLVSNYLDIDQVPSIYQVPDLLNNLPPGMISPTSNWVMDVIVWQEI